MREVKYSFEQWCLDTDHRDLLDLWDYDLNDLTPGEIAFKAKERVWIKCARGLHESELCAPRDMVEGKRHTLCSRCDSFGRYIIDTFGSDAIEKYRSPDEDIDWFTVKPRARSKKLLFRCDNPTHPDYRMIPVRFSNGQRCALCSNRRIQSGINDIATTHPHLVKYFLNPDDAKTRTIKSGVKTWFVCPDCGTKRYSSPSMTFIYNHYPCRACGDGVSYGNKFIRCLLSQAGAEYEVEKVFDWSLNVGAMNSKRMYDFYLTKPHPMIVEVHGIQHYDKPIAVGGKYRTLEEERENDDFKRNLALENGISPDCYIELDCRKSELSYIKQSVLNSNLLSLLGVNEEDVDWGACDVATTKSMVKLAADLWKSGVCCLSDIAEAIGCSHSSVCNYLKRADDLGWIVYESRFRKPVLCNETGFVFETLGTCSEYSEELLGVAMDRQHIGAVCRGETHSTQGYTFEYISVQDYRDILASEPERVFQSKIC